MNSNETTVFGLPDVKMRKKRKRGGRKGKNKAFISKTNEVENKVRKLLDEPLPIIKMVETPSGEIVQEVSDLSPIRADLARREEELREKEKKVNELFEKILPKVSEITEKKWTHQEQVEKQTIFVATSTKSKSISEVLQAFVSSSSCDTAHTASVSSNCAISASERLQEMHDEVDIKMGIIDDRHPDIVLAEHHADVIQEKIVAAIDNIPVGIVSPRFNQTFYENGVLWIICADSATKKWLIDTVRLIKDSLNGITLNVVTENDIPQRPRYIVWIPDCTEENTVRSRLQVQNPDLKTDHWVLLNRKVEDNGQSLLYSVDQESAETLTELDFKPYYKLGRATFREVAMRKDVGTFLCSSKFRQEEEQCMSVSQSSNVSRSFGKERNPSPAHSSTRDHGEFKEPASQSSLSANVDKPFSKFDTKLTLGSRFNEYHHGIDEASDSTISARNYESPATSLFSREQFYDSPPPIIADNRKETASQSTVVSGEPYNEPFFAPAFNKGAEQSTKPTFVGYTSPSSQVLVNQDKEQQSKSGTQSSLKSKNAYQWTKAMYVKNSSSVAEVTFDENEGQSSKPSVSNYNSALILPTRNRTFNQPSRPEGNSNKTHQSKPPSQEDSSNKLQQHKLYMQEEISNRFHQSIPLGQQAIGNKPQQQVPAEQEDIKDEALQPYTPPNQLKPGLLGDGPPKWGLVKSYSSPSGPFRPPASPFQQPSGPFQQPSRPFQQPPRPFQQPPRPFQQPPRPFQQPPRPFQQPPRPFQQPPRPFQQAPRPFHQPPRPFHQPPRPFHQPSRPLYQPSRPFQPLSRPHRPLSPLAGQSLLGVPRFGNTSQLNQSPINGRFPGPSPSSLMLGGSKFFSELQLQLALKHVIDSRNSSQQSSTHGGQQPDKNDA